MNVIKKEVIKLGTIENGKIILSGRVDSFNATQVEQELFAAWQGGDAVIDAEKLEYISSAGLRILMKLRKQTQNVIVENVSPGVYDILEVTGFTKLLGKCFSLFGLLRMSVSLNTDRGRQPASGVVALVRENLFPHTEDVIQLFGMVL